MADVKMKLILEDKASPTFSKSHKQALANADAFMKLEQETKQLTEQWDHLYDIGLQNSKMADDLITAVVDNKQAMQDYANGTREASEENENFQLSATELNSSLQLLTKAWDALGAVVQKAYAWMELSDKQFNAEFTAATKMHNILGASDDEIKSMYDYAASLQQVGIVGDEVVISGMSELSLFASTADQVKQLMPGILDLAVAQNGLETSMGDVTSAANSIGKALNGQARTLRRQLGLSEDQAKALDEMNDKTEKAAKLTELLTSKFGNANKILAETSQGSLRQTKNAMGDLGEVLGEKVTPYIAAFEEAVYKLLKPAIEWVADNMEWIAPVFIAVAAVIGIVIVALTALAIQNFIAGASWLASLGPILLVVAAIGLVVAACVFVMKKIDETTGKTRSALGLITGMISTFVSIVYDILIVPLWNGIAELANFFGNFLNHPLETTQITLMEFAWNALNILYGLANALDHIFGSNLASGIDSVMGKIKNAQNELKEATDYKEYMQKLDYWDIDKAARQGYDFGASISDNISKGIEGSDFFGKFGDALTVDGTGNSALNTTSKEGLLSDEDIQLLLDVATRDYKLNYQQITPEITLTFGDVHQEVDLENAIDVLADELESIYDGDLGGVPA